MSELLGYLNSHWPQKRFTLVCEASYGSFSPEEKETDIQAIRTAGYFIKGFKSTMTEKRRRIWGVKKTDINDLVAIAYIGRNHPLRTLTVGGRSPIFPSRDRYIRERMRGHAGVKAEIKQLLPAFRFLDPECQAAFGSKSGYSESVASLLVCAFRDPNCLGIKTFERIIGLHGNGIGVFRSTLVRRMYTDRRSGILRVPKGRFQYWLRWMYHQMAKTDRTVSASDLRHSS